MRATCAALPKAIGRRLVAKRPVAAQVVRHIVEQKRRVALDGVEHADHRRQHLVIDDQRVGGALRLLARFRHDEGNRIADMAHLALRQRRMRRLLHRQAVLAGDAPAAGQSADTGGLEIFAGEHAEHARHGKRRGRVNRLDSGVRMRRAYEHAHHHVRPFDVGNIVAAAGQEALILFAERPGADADDV
jgi:hypothetical protein